MGTRCTAIWVARLSKRSACIDCQTCLSKVTHLPRDVAHAPEDQFNNMLLWLGAACNKHNLVEVGYARLQTTGSIVSAMPDTFG